MLYKLFIGMRRKEQVPQIPKYSSWVNALGYIPPLLERIWEYNENMLTIVCAVLRVLSKS